MASKDAASPKCLPYRPPCRYWNQGNCKYGDSCRYRHGTLPAQASHAGLQTASAPSAAAYPTDGCSVGLGLEDAKEVQIVKAADLEHLSHDQIEIRDYTFHASYNWIQNDNSRIIIPGCPPVWSVPRLPITVPADTPKYVDRKDFDHIANYDAMLLALSVMEPSFRMDRVDIVLSVRILRDLLAFMEGSIKKGWRLEVESINGTVFLIRWEAKPTLHGTGSLNSGYGHSFAKALTQHDSEFEECDSHHRIISYDIGGLRCLVQHEVDAYERENSPEVAFQSKPERHDDVQPMRSYQADLKFKNLASIQRGKIIPLNCLIEIKSRNTGDFGIRSNTKFAERQMLFSQTPTLTQGRHHKGLISEEPKRIDMTPVLASFMFKHTTKLRGMVELINRIRKEALKTANGRLTILFGRIQNEKVCRMYQVESDGLKLGEEVKAWFWT